MSDQVLEVSGPAGEAIELPLGNAGPTGYSWTLDYPDGVEAAGETEGDSAERGEPTGSRLLVRAPEPGRFELAARLARPWDEEPIRSVLIRLTVG